MHSLTLPTLALAALLATGAAQGQTTTSGGCSPVVADTTGDVTITLDCSFGPDPADDFEVTLLRARLACNSAVEAEDRAAAAPGEGPDRVLDLLTGLQALDGEFVYVDLSVWVGAGCGYDDVAGDPPPRWGVVYDLLPVLDGFTGDPGPMPTATPTRTTSTISRPSAGTRPRRCSSRPRTAPSSRPATARR
jgi:hypothetical protein